MPDQRPGRPEIPVRRYGVAPTGQAIPLRRRPVPVPAPRPRQGRRATRLGLALLGCAAASIGLLWWLG